MRAVEKRNDVTVLIDAPPPPADTPASRGFLLPFSPRLRYSPAVHVSQGEPPRRRRIVIAATCFALAVFGVYLANGRGESGGDVDPTAFLPVALVRGDGLTLDRFPQVFGARGEFTHGVTFARGHVISRYPVAAALVAAPFTALQMKLLDGLRPGWDVQHVQFFAVGMAKTSHALIAALAAGLFLGLCLALGVGWPAAGLSAVAFALGSTMWSVAAQGAWQHGPAALGAVAAMAALATPAPGRGRLLLAGLAAALMVACRSLNLLFAVALTIPVVRAHGRRSTPFFIFPLLVGASLLAYNVYFFGALHGGQSHLETLHPKFHGVDGTWTGSLWDGAAGTLFSPSRGLFVFSSWTLCALLLLPLVWTRPSPPWLKSLAVALGALLLALSKYSCWWAGWSFGPRFWTDALPVWGVLFALGLDAAWRARPWRWFWLPATLAVFFSAAVHGLGAFAYPSTWNAIPRSVDFAHERLWDWRDSELVRLRKEGLKAPVLWDWPSAGGERN